MRPPTLLVLALLAAASACGGVPVAPPVVVAPPAVRFVPNGAEGKGAVAVFVRGGFCPACDALEAFAWTSEDLRGPAGRFVWTRKYADDAAVSEVFLAGPRPAVWVSQGGGPWKRVWPDGQGELADTLTRVMATTPFARSTAFEGRVAALKKSGDLIQAKAVARQWCVFLDTTSSSPAAKTALASHRLVAALELGEVQAVLPMLTAMEADAPTSPEPPLRLARAFLELERYPEALGAVERAQARAHGVSEVRVLALKAEILAKKQDRGAARATLRDAVERARALALYGDDARLRAVLEVRLATWK